MSKRKFLTCAIASIGLLCSFSPLEAQNQNEHKAGALIEDSNTANVLRIFKSPTCGCCEQWVEHVQASGLNTETYHPVDLNQIKTEYAVPAAAQSCHTAVSENGYVFEGHVPAKYIHQFLENPPEDAIGLAVPAMPMGSPGMEAGDPFMPYNVLLLKSDGTTELFAEVKTQAEQY